MEKLKAQYRSLVRDSAQAKRKYQEASKGAQPLPAPSRCVPGVAALGRRAAVWEHPCVRGGSV